MELCSTRQGHGLGRTYFSALYPSGLTPYSLLFLLCPSQLCPETAICSLSCSCPLLSISAPSLLRLLLPVAAKKFCKKFSAPGENSCFRLIQMASGQHHFLGLNESSSVTHIHIFMFFHNHVCIKHHLSSFPTRKAL